MSVPIAIIIAGLLIALGVDQAGARIAHQIDLWRLQERMEK